MVEQRFADDPLFQHVVVYGDGKKYLVAGVWLSPLAVEPGLDGAALHALVEAKITAVNATLASYESIKRFAILEPALSVASGHLTPTLKVKRKAVYATFGAQLDTLYERSTR